MARAAWTISPWIPGRSSSVTGAKGHQSESGLAPDLPRPLDGQVATNRGKRPVLAQRIALVRKVSQERATGLVRHRREVVDLKQPSQPRLRDPGVPAEGTVILECPTLPIGGGRTD